jgi:hypothetical protein
MVHMVRLTFLQRLWRSELATLGALLASAAIVGCLGFVDSVRAGKASLLPPADAAWIGFAYTMVLGALPALLYGAPAYALLAQAGRASWSTTLLIGLVPGLLALLVETSLGVWALGCGVAVACATHFLVQRWTRRSNSTPHMDARAHEPHQQPPSACAGGRGR